MSFILAFKTGNSAISNSIFSFRILRFKRSCRRLLNCLLINNRTKDAVLFQKFLKKFPIKARKTVISRRLFSLNPFKSKSYNNKKFFYFYCKKKEKKDSPPHPKRHSSKKALPGSTTKNQFLKPAKLLNRFIRKFRTLFSNLPEPGLFGFGLSLTHSSLPNLIRI